MGLKVVTAPPVEPIGLAEAKDHLRVDISDDDALIDQLILGARKYAEEICGLALITTVFDETWDWRFPERLTPRRAPLQSVGSVTYVDTEGATQTVAASVYTVDTSSDIERGRIVEAYGKTWPATRRVINAVTLRYTAGFGDGPGDVPEPIKHALLLMIGNGYKHREEIVTGASVAQIPRGALKLLAPWRMPAV